MKPSTSYYRIDLSSTLAKTESVYEAIRNDTSGVVNNQVRTILGLAAVMDGETDTATLTDNSDRGDDVAVVNSGRSRRSASEPVAIVAPSSSAFHNGRKERHRTESSNTSSSLNYSSSVEVISEICLLYTSPSPRD